MLSGELNLTAGDKHYVLKPGDEKVVVEKFTMHSFWNEQDSPVCFRAEIFPPKNIEKGLRLSYALAQQGKISKNNLPYNPFYTLILMDYFDSYLWGIPWRIQRGIYRIGSKFANFMGYSSTQI